MYYPDIMHIHVLITKDQRNTSRNFAFHYNSDKLKKWKENLPKSHAPFWSSRKNVTEAKEKKLLISVRASGWDFFSDEFFPNFSFFFFFTGRMPVNFFRNSKWIKKILNIKRKLKKRKKNEVSRKRKNSQKHLFQLM